MLKNKINQHISQIALDLPKSLKQDNLAELFMNFQNMVINTIKPDAVADNDLTQLLFDIVFISRGFRSMDKSLQENLDFETHLQTLCDSFNQQPFVTYGGLIDVNASYPFEEIRTFSGLDSEKHFYIGHHIIEASFRDILKILKPYPAVSQQDTQQICTLIKNIYTDGFNYLHEKLEPRQFHQFFTFFGDLNGIKGPGAVYSPGIPLLEKTLYGRMYNGSPVKSVEFFIANTQYYSSQAVGQFNSLPDESEQIACQNIAQELLNFRAQHYSRLIRHYLEDYVDPEMKEFLKERINDNKTRIK